MMLATNYLFCRCYSVPFGQRAEEREIYVRLERRKRLQETESKNLPRQISAFDDVWPEAKSQPRDRMTTNGSLGKPLVPEPL
jgi:hypothetical protein